MELMGWIPFVFMGGNLIFAVFVFTFLARSAGYHGSQSSLDQNRRGSISEQKSVEAESYRGISLLLLLLLFLTSCITGGVIAHVRLYEQAEQFWSR